MSELLDKVLKVQDGAGCTVLEAKKFLEQADGDIDLAIMIAKEELAKPKPQSSVQPHYQQPQQYGSQQPYAQPYPQHRPMNPEQAKKNMRLLRQTLYGFGALCAAAAILMFFAEFVKASIFGIGIKMSGFQLLFSEEARKESPSIYAMIAPLVMFGLGVLFPLAYLTKADERNTKVIFISVLMFIAAVMCFLTITICGDYVKGADLGGGAIGAGLFGIFGAISIACAGALPNVFNRQQ